MSTTARINYLERLFSRSCLESSVALARLPQRLLKSAVTRSRDRAHTELHQLKRQLLREALEATPHTSLFKPLCGAANQAADEAWGTPYPLMVFPCLFEELANRARERHAARASFGPESPSFNPVYEWAGPNLVGAAS